MNYTKEMIENIDNNCVSFFFSNTCEILAKNYVAKEKDFYVEIAVKEMNENIKSKNNSIIYHHVIRICAKCNNISEQISFIPLLTNDKDKVKEIINKIRENLQNGIDIKLSMINKNNKNNNKMN